MNNANLARIDALIDQVIEAEASERNRRRQNVWPTAVFQLEQPIAEAKIFEFDANRYFSDPAFYFEHVLRLKLWRWEHFPDDDAVLSSDIPAWLGHYPEYTFLGMKVAFTSSGVPDIQTDHPLAHNPDVRLLEPVEFKTSGWMPRIVRWYDDLRQIADGRVNVTFNMVWWRGCLDLAIQLRGYENFILDTMERPVFVHELMAFLVEQRKGWWAAYYNYFDVAVSPTAVGDDWVHVPFISPQLFADFVLPYYLEIERFHGGISSLHSCGNQGPLQKYLLAIKSLPGLEVSVGTDLMESLENVPAHKPLAVALHPNDVLVATADDMEAKLRFITEVCAGRRYSIGTSGLTPIWNDIGEYIRRIKMWTEIVQRVLGPLRTPVGAKQDIDLSEQVSSAAHIVSSSTGKKRVP